jgi:hypothetical protein
MSAFITLDPWKEIASLSKNAKQHWIAVAYLTDYSEIFLKSNDYLIVDASDEAIKAGQTSAQALDTLFKRGVRIYSLPKLHAKIYVMDNYVIIGSMNASSSSRNCLKEGAVVITDEELAEEAKAQVLELQEKAEPINKSFLDRIATIAIDRNCITSEKQEDTFNKPDMIWVLKKTPSGNRLRAYFIALIKLQIGEKLEIDMPFLLWPGANVSDHEKKNRLKNIGPDKYCLTRDGTQYFERADQLPKEDFLNCFLSAIKSGDNNQLPEGLTNEEMEKLFL